MNKPSIAVWALGALFCFCTLSGCKTKSGVTKQQGKSIVILHENDMHCAVQNYQKIAGLRDAISDTSYVGIVSSGDYLQGGTAGAISTGKYVIDVMKEVGYDAVTLGNHEFDYKIPRMKELLTMLGAPVTCVNLADVKTKERLYAPYIMKQYGDTKIAFVGATTPTTRVTEEYSFVDEDGNELLTLQPEKLSSLIQDAVNDARAKGAKYVILISHLGEDKNEFNSDSHTIIANTYGIDAVFDGHTHSVVNGITVNNKLGKPVIVSQTGTKLANVGKLVIKNGKLYPSLVPLAEVTRDNEKVKHAYDIMLAQSQGFTEAVAADLEYELVVDDANSVKLIRMGETNAGDLVADAIWDYSKADIAMQNAGGIRSTIKAGKLTYGKIMDLVPYDNRLVVVEVTGSKIIELLTGCISSLPEDDGDFPQVAGIKFTVDGTKHTVSDVQVWNKTKNDYEPIDLNKKYILATLDYTVSGGGFRGILKKEKVVSKDSKTASDMVAIYVKGTLKGKVGKEYAQPKGRITVKY